MLGPNEASLVTGLGTVVDAAGFPVTHGRQSYGYLHNYRTRNTVTYTRYQYSTFLGMLEPKRNIARGRFRDSNRCGRFSSYVRLTELRVITVTAVSVTP